MIPLKTYIELHEVAYKGNIGIMELIKFYQKATPEMVVAIKKLIADNQNDKAWEMIEKVTGVKLQKA